ncbi:uncharacterized protein MELLADRAFT_115405 [Melampsora larici-populina 98AG31]|uniref:Mitochondrial carrier protein n=1 Tax=Melampsora larici-populina (strain 98AG31 / pathotype 3-4-7) TaxID=747676 RepID=F4RA83_MELLP|nr:uncharacterized protein MELLADRAFT_115405 [Melampsora larici-populina 98AG31]EGG10432.1 hypothetical protein MELLADRAFT_115405 [Melampsora larici-populina 98AG31]
MDINHIQPSTSEPFNRASTTFAIGFNNLSEKAIGKMKANNDSSLPDTLTQQTGSDLKTLEQTDSNDLTSLPSNHKNPSLFEGAGKYLLSGGIAGMVSRTATAPFDRVKIYLITSEKPLSIQPHPSPSFATLSGSRTTVVLPAQQPIYRLIPNSSNLLIAVKLIYQEPAGARPGPGGLRNFFVGNGLNVLKIFPESAIKFLTYEYIKMALGQGCLGMSPATDTNGNLTNRARFLAGGLGGVVSQFAIYPIETLKTQIMSSTINHNVKRSALLFQTIRRLNASGGIKSYYKGVAAATVGVFPYSELTAVLTIEIILEQQLIFAIGEPPGVLGTLACGALSGGIGASSVYPINLVRTRLQAQGTSAHPATYRGIGDCVERTWRKEGFRGFYKGLAPSLFKVMPAVSISWLVYERTILMLDGLS